MKKIFITILLILTFMFPVICEAKAKLELDKELENLLLLEIKDGKYVYLNLDITQENYNQPGSILFYDSEGEKIGEDTFITGELDDDMEELFKSPYFLKYMLSMYEIENYPLIVKEDTYYYVDYINEVISCNNSTGEELDDILFTDVEKTRSVLGGRYDIFLEVKKYNVNITNIKEYNGIYFVYYYDDNNDYVSIMDSNKKIIKTFNDIMAQKNIYYAYDNLIYVMKENKTIDIYTIEGNFYQTYTAKSDYFTNTVECGGLIPVRLFVDNNKLHIHYIISECDERKEINGVLDLVREDEEEDNIGLVQIYNIDYDVSATKSDNGNITYESKTDADGKEYIELKITPKEGYEVKEIIVKDASGKKIEVKDNKFFMPNSDVIIDVQFRLEGEYVPIPDTSLNKNLTIILIGIILISLGAYTISYVKSE